MAGDAASAAASAASAAASAAGTANATAESLFEASVVFGFAMISAIVAHAVTNTVVQRYESKMVQLMNEDSSAAFSTAMPGSVEVGAEALLQAIDRRRRALLAALVGVVALYAVAATVVMRLFGPEHDSTRVGLVHDLVSLVLFAAVSAPVVLLGVSASNFERQFWRWCAPPFFIGVALQTALMNQVVDAARLLEVLTAFAALVLITAGVLLRRHWLLPRLTGRAQRWLGSKLFATVAVVVGVGVLAVALPGAYDRMAFGAGMGAVAIGVLRYALIDRVRRIVAPLLAMAGFAAFAALCAMAALAMRTMSGPGFIGVVGLALMVLASIVAFYAVLSWVGLAHEQKVFSDAQFQVFCWMVTAGAIAVGFTAMSVPEEKRLDGIGLYLALMGCTALALLVYWAVVRYGIPSLPTNRRLLVLRVFSAERSGERLLDELEEYWRTIGPIMLIGGTDVAKRTIDPAKAANFIRGRLDDICVPNLFMLVKRVEGMDELPDPDGRYRVNEFFCTRDLWKQAVARLLSMSDAIVVDLTEFTARNAGTAWELGLLEQRGALERTVCLVSAQTDLEAVRRVLRVPPGRPLPAGSVIEVEREVDGRRLVEALLQRLPAVPMARPVPDELPLDAPDTEPQAPEIDLPAARPAVTG